MAKPFSKPIHTEFCGYELTEELNAGTRRKASSPPLMRTKKPTPRLKGCQSRGDDYKNHEVRDTTPEKGFRPALEPSARLRWIIDG